MREVGRIPNENPKWIILDGDLDAVSMKNRIQWVLNIR